MIKNTKKISEIQRNNNNNDDNDNGNNNENNNNNNNNNTNSPSLRGLRSRISTFVRSRSNPNVSNTIYHYIILYHCDLS